jgi:hypothetical protein
MPELQQLRARLLACLLACVLVARVAAQFPTPVPPLDQMIAGEMLGPNIDSATIYKPFAVILSNGTLAIWPRTAETDAVSAALGPVRAFKFAGDEMNQIGVFCGLRLSDSTAACASVNPGSSTVATYTPPRTPFSQLVMRQSAACGITFASKLECWGYAFGIPNGLKSAAASGIEVAVVGLSHSLNAVAIRKGRRALCLLPCWHRCSLTEFVALVVSVQTH